MENSNGEYSIPVLTVPTPTNQYRRMRKEKESFELNGVPKAMDADVIPIPIPLPFLSGSRVLIFKQDPSVAEIGIRKAYISSYLSNGPKDARVHSKGMAPVNKNAFGDFIQTPGTDAFDAVQAFAVVRMTLTMAQRALSAVGNTTQIPWQWNNAANSDPLNVFAHGLPDTMNAFYSRSDKALKFGDFIEPSSNPPRRLFTCRSLDIVAHETGHAILDSLKPGWIGWGNPPQTGGLHEAFGDITAIFLALAQFDQVEAVIAQTKSNLHNKTFLAELAEQFGSALGRPNGLRNADNDLTLAQTGNEVHAISQVFTGAIYDILADIFSYERKPAKVDDAKVLYDSASYLYGLLLRAILQSPATNALFADVANNMLTISVTDGKPVNYRTFIRNRFTIRGAVISPTPANLEKEFKENTVLQARHEFDHKSVQQDRDKCCGTMKHEQYYDEMDKYLQDELDELKKIFSNGLGHH